MNCEKIKEKLVTLCADVFTVSNCNTDLIEHMDFFEDLGMDSITFMTLIVKIESCFDITVPDALLLMDNFKKLDDVIQIVIAQTIKNDKKTAEMGNVVNDKT